MKLRDARTPDTCRWLRWKGLYTGSFHDPQVPNPSDGFCWCVHTQNCIGPDGGLAERESCGESRPCFEKR